jgi:hypothetical protein
MKFSRIKPFTVAVTFSFVFYSIVGCSTTRATKYLDKYDSLPYTDKVDVHASYNAAYKGAIVSLKKRGYRVTLSDPATGIAELEYSSLDKIPEETKQDEVANQGPSAGTVILIALSIVLIVGIVILIANSSDDDSKDHKKETSKDNSKGTSPGRGGGELRNSNLIQHDDFHHERHEHHDYTGPIIYPLIDAFANAPSPNPSYLYIVSLTATTTKDSTTQIRLSTDRLDIVSGSVQKSERIENKYLNYSIFNGILEEVHG